MRAWQAARGRAPLSQDLRCELRERRTLTLRQDDVTRDRFVLEALGDLREAVVRRVEVGMIDLIRIARQDDLGAFTRARDDRLDLVRSEILRLVDDHVVLRQRATADIR